MIRFPQCQEVRLQRAPLAEVICQVRFPPVLRIANEHPVAFQERVRGRFPQLDIEQGVVVHIPPPLGTESPSAEPRPRIYRFKSPDGNTIVSLALNFYALSTTSYTHWADFIDSFRLLNEAAREVYDLPYAVRVGLRYINHLTFGHTGASSVAGLLEIPRPELTVLLRQDCWDRPVEMVNQLVLTGENDERLALRSGFRGGEEPVFTLDLDYYAEGNIPLETVPALCQRYHDVIYSAFRWCIREDKLTVFAPLPVEEEN
jgi:uncharacterized protein (TIGR04255 family)